MQHRKLLGRPAVAKVQGVVAHIVDDDVAAALIPVSEMEDEEGVGVDPCGRTAVERDQADTGAQARLPLQHRLSLRRRLRVEDRRTGEQHDVLLGQNEVVHHGRRVQRDRKRLLELAGRIDHIHFDGRRLERIGDRIEGAGGRVAAVVRPKGDGLVGSRLPLADGVEAHGHFIAGRRLVEREQAAPVAQHVDEGAVLERPRIFTWADQGGIDRHGVGEAAEDRVAGAPLGRQAAGPNEAVAIARPAIVEIDGVDHPVAVHRVGEVDRLELRIGPVAHIDAAEVRRDAPGDHLEVVGVDFLADRQEVAAEVRVVGGPGDVAGFQGGRGRCAETHPGRGGQERHRPAKLPSRGAGAHGLLPGRCRPARLVDGFAQA